jgi:threonine synthase
MNASASLASHQSPVGHPKERFPLFPPLDLGIPAAHGRPVWPAELIFDYNRVPRGDLRPELFDLLLPPRDAALTLGEGDTPLFDCEFLARKAGLAAKILIKDEAANPTGSHKDRYAYFAMCAAAASAAPGVVLSSSGNHGAAVAAYAARAGVPCIVFGLSQTPGPIVRQCLEYGARFYFAHFERRWELVHAVHEKHGWAVMSTVTEPPSGHPFGIEGYKAIAFELLMALGGPPDAIVMPTGYGELLFGVWKGFVEAQQLNWCRSVPKLFAVEPESRSPHQKALRVNADWAIDPRPAISAMSSIDTRICGPRGVLALRNSGGSVLVVNDEETRVMQQELSGNGISCELSSAAAFAGLHRHADELKGFQTIVVINTARRWKEYSDIAPDVKTVSKLSDIS